VTREADPLLHLSRHRKREDCVDIGLLVREREDVRARRLGLDETVRDEAQRLQASRQRAVLPHGEAMADRQIGLVFGMGDDKDGHAGIVDGILRDGAILRSSRRMPGYRARPAPGLGLSQG
jgi:hypothetical protein